MQFPFSITFPAIPTISGTTTTSYFPAYLKPSRVLTSASNRASTALQNIPQLGGNFIKWSSNSRTIQDCLEVVQLAWTDLQRLTPYAWFALLSSTLLFVLLITLTLHKVKPIFRRDYRLHQKVPLDMQTQQEEHGCLREKEFVNIESLHYDTIGEQEQRDFTESQHYDTVDKQEQSHISPSVRLLRSECRHLRAIERQIWGDDWREKAAHVEHGAKGQDCWAREYASSSNSIFTCE